MPKLSFSDVRLNYDPSAPQQRFRDAGLGAAFASPIGTTSFGSPVARGRRTNADLADAVTCGHRRSFPILKITMLLWLHGRPQRPPPLAALFTPAHPISSWWTATA